MEGTFKPPKSLIFDKNIQENLENFLRSLNIYLKATGLISKDGETKVAILLNHAGEEAQTKFQTFNLSEEDKNDFDAVVDAFRNYCKPLKNETYDRYKFFTRKQQEGEDFDHFLTDVRMLAANCNFGSIETSLIRDKIVSGINDLGLQERLLQIAVLTETRAETICRTAEVSRHQVKDLRNDKEVDVVKYSKKHEVGEPSTSNKNFESIEYDCLKCGRKHAKMNCPAFGKKCNICLKLNHFAIGCLSRNKNSSSNRHKDSYTSRGTNRHNNVRRRVHEVNEDCDENGDESLFIDQLTINTVKSESNYCWTVNVQINNNDVKFKMDTGANCNCLPLSVFYKLGLDENNINTNSLAIVAYGNNTIKTVGTIITECFVKGVRYNVKFVIVDVNSNPILGLNACTKMNLLKKVDMMQTKYVDKNDVINKHKDVFSGTGKIPFEYKIVLRRDAKPFVSGCRRIPDTIKPLLKESLDDLVKRDIICKVDEPSEWVNNIVLVEKSNNKIRICLDPVHLNKYTCDDQYPIPTLEELTVKLKNKSIFSVLDLKEGFYNIPLEKESMKYTCFITPFGKYCFKRLPFGLNISPEVFQRMNERMFGDLGIGIYIDDFIIAAESEEEHDKILNSVIQRAKQYNVKFNVNKIQFKVKEVKYLGQIFSIEGVKPDPEYIRAIQKLEYPENKKQLLTFIGMVNYLTRYIPSLSNLMAPLRELIKNNTPWMWTVDHNTVFNNIKSLITKIPHLKIFDPAKQIEIQCDASQFGIGGCLLQDGQPVAFSSRSLTETETRYPQIDKELLSICFTLNKFNNLIYGRKILIKTDHKPLVSICNKDFYKVSGRLQRLKLKLLKYKFDIEYLPGRFMYIADFLSRSFMSGERDNLKLTYTVHTMDIQLPISEKTLKELKTATNNDHILNTIKDYNIKGWPTNLKQFNSSELATFSKIHNDLIVKNDLIFYNDKLVVPSSLRKTMLKKLHTAHLGIEKTKARARKIFFWPRMSTDIQNFVSKCDACLKFSRVPGKEPLIQHERPNIPFYKVGTDILNYGGKDYLVLVDYFSNWIELVLLKNKSASEVVYKLKQIFARFGIPVIVVSDNNPFNSVEFKRFALEWEFNVVTVSPRYPKSNGLSEKAVGMCKNILKKCNETGTDIFKALLEYRTTPLAGFDMSPSELLNRRMLRSILPVTNNILNRKPDFDFQKLNNKRENAKKYYDQHAKVRLGFKEGDRVIIRNELTKMWVPGEIIGKSTTPRSYLVRDNHGNVLRRNSSFIRQSPNVRGTANYENLHLHNDIEPSPLKSEPTDVLKNVRNESMIERNSDMNRSLGGDSNHDDLPIAPYKTRLGRIIKKPTKYSE